MNHNKKIRIVMATLMTVQAVVHPITALANEVDLEQEETILEKSEIEESTTTEENQEKNKTADNQEETKDQVNEGQTFFSIEEKESLKESVNKDSLVTEKDEAENQDSGVPQATTHLLSKAKFQGYLEMYKYLIDSQDLIGLRFVASEVPTEIDVSNQTDLSENGDRSVIAYRDGKIGIITSGVKGESIELPADSSKLMGGWLGDRLNGIVSKLITVSFEAIDTSNVTNMSHMFEQCTGLTTLDVSQFDTSNVTNMSYMFRGCEGLTTLDVGKFDTSNATDTSHMFRSCYALTTLDVSQFDTSHITDMSYMFDSCWKLTTLDISNFNTSNVINMEGMFSSCQVLTTLDLSNFNTSNVINMKRMFAYCYALTTLDVSQFDTSNVTNMGFMFTFCNRLTTLDLSNFNTSNVTDMSSMFSECKGLTALDLSNFNTSNVTSMEWMFARSDVLTALDLSNFNTSNVTDMSNMFFMCKGLTTVELSSFNTSNVTDMAEMFWDCVNLITLDLSGFDMSNVTNTTRMFNSCFNLVTIYANDWNLGQNVKSQSMFTDCSKLVGTDSNGKKTYYNASRVTGKMATPNNGYFTVPDKKIAFINFINEQGQVQKKVRIELSIDEMTIPADKILAEIPIGYELKNPLPILEVSATGVRFDIVIQLKPVKWTAIIEYVSNGQRVRIKEVEVTDKNPVVTAEEINLGIPTGYRAKAEVTNQTVTADNLTVKIAVEPILLTATIKYVSIDGTVVGTSTYNTTEVDLLVPVSAIMNAMPQGYEAVNQVMDQKITKENPTVEIQVEIKEVEWNAAVKYITADGIEVGSHNFTVTNKNPNISAIEIEKNIPQNYVATVPITDQTVTQNNEVITIQVELEEVQWTVTINFISNARAMIGSASFQVTNLNPVVTAVQIKGAIPTGYEAAETIGDITATQDGQIFDIQVQPMTVSTPVDETWTITIDFKDGVGNSVGATSLMIKAANPVISVEELNSMLPAGYKLLLDNPVTVLADSIANGVGTIIVPVLPVLEGNQTPGGDNPTGGFDNQEGKGLNKNEEVNTSVKTMTGLYATLGLVAVGSIGSIMVKRRKKK